MVSGFSRLCPPAVIVAFLAWLQIADATSALAQSPDLVVNPLLARDLPVPGWIGGHRDAWVRQHPVYASACQNIEVAKEIRFLNRVIAYDEYLLSLTNSPDPDNSAATGLARVARQAMPSLRRDIVRTDTLVALLRLLPACDVGRREAAVMPARAMQEVGANLATSTTWTGEAGAGSRD